MDFPLSLGKLFFDWYSHAYHDNQIDSFVKLKIVKYFSLSFYLFVYFFDKCFIKRLLTTVTKFFGNLLWFYATLIRQK